MKFFKYIFVSFAFLALLLTTNNNLAFAQEEKSSLQIEEIIVTAQKREQSAQDVPISITAMGRASQLNNKESCRYNWV